MISFLRKIRKIKALRIIARCSVPFLPVFCLFIMDYMNFDADLGGAAGFMQSFPKAYLFQLLVILTVFIFLLLLCRKTVVAGGILGLLSLACAYTNYMKLAMNGDNFYPRDLTLMRNAGEMISFISARAPGWFWLGAAVTALWIFALWLFEVELPLRRRIRIPAAIALALAVIVLFFTPRRSEAVLNKFGMSFFDAALQSSNYTANSFLGAFTLNLLSMHTEKPAGYSKEFIASLLDDYEATPATGEDFDVIVVLSESFFDARILDGVSFSENPLPNYDDIISRPNCYSGMMYTTAINGGTVRPEFEILTGLTTDYLPSGATPYEYATRDMPSYVSEYRDAGYYTVALHPFNKKFYSRSSAYGFIGFDDFYSETELSERAEAEYKRGYITDNSLLEAMRYYLDESGRPTFMFAITMQNHQPFDPPEEGDEIRIKVESEVLSDETLGVVTTYTQGLFDADKMLGDLAEYIDNRDRPTVLLFFGDHLPNLGNNHAAYLQTGLFGDMLAMETRLKMYSTPYLIYSNRQLPQGVFKGNTGNDLSAHYLLGAVAVSTGFERSAYTNLLLDYIAETPYYNVRLNMPVTDEIRELTQAMKYITYDRLIGGNYSSG